MVKSQQNKKNTITGKDAESPTNGIECEDNDIIISKTKNVHNFSNEDTDVRNSNGDKDINIRDGKSNLKTKTSNKINCRNVSPSTTGTTALDHRRGGIFAPSATLPPAAISSFLGLTNCLGTCFFGEQFLCSWQIFSSSNFWRILTRKTQYFKIVR